MRSFASDNNASVHPRVMQAVVDANRDHAVGYGDDPWTEKALEAIRHVFGETAHPFLAFNGTGANSIALQAVTRPFNSIVCASTGHIYVDECGAPARMTGCQITPVDTPDGKLTPAMIESLLHVAGVEHHSQPGAVYISQSTELGTVYTISEVRALTDFAHSYGMHLVMDGARLANACAALGCTLREMTLETGVDVLCFGGTKNGMMMGEAVVVFSPEIAANIKFIRKQSAQLASKMRYLAAQWPAYLDVGTTSRTVISEEKPAPIDYEPLWLSNARHANRMAVRLAEILARFGERYYASDPGSGLKSGSGDAAKSYSEAGATNLSLNPGDAAKSYSDNPSGSEVRFTQKVESNQIFCILPPEILTRLRKNYFFYMWDDAGGEARFITSWDTTDDDLAAFEKALNGD